MEERRKYIRIPDESQISCKIITGKRAHEYMTKNISKGGIKFLVHDFIPKDSILKIKLVLYKTSATFEALVRTMWVRQVPNSDQYEIGVQFIDIPHEAVDHLIDYIKIFLSRNPMNR